MSYPDEREYRLEYPTDDTPAFRLADMAPKRRRPRWVIPLACMLAVAVLAGGAGAWAYSVRASTPAAAPAPSLSTSASPSAAVSPEVAQLDEELACVVLVPLMTELVGYVDALTKDGKKPDKAAIAKLETNLRDLQNRAPADMRPDIVELVQAASTLSAGGFYGSQVSGPGVRLLERCRKYARS